MKAGVVITERGWPAHFICADRCLFRRNTLIECGNRRIVVSTVGAMRDVTRGGAFEEIGAGHYFETGAFRAKRSEPAGYWDVDVHRTIPFEAPRYLTTKPHWGSDAEADAMHEAVVAELTAKLRKAARR